MKHNLIALFDMDGTVADFDGAMRRDLAQLANPSEIVIPHCGPSDDEEPPWLKARKRLIKTQRGWWRNLPEHSPGMEIFHLTLNMGFSPMVLTKGPFRNSQAWEEKVDWCREHLPDTPVTITENKGIMYGKMLVDDWPPYGIGWLKWRPRGLLVVPAWPWNTLDQYPEDLHCNIFRYTGAEGDKRRLTERLAGLKAAL